MRTRMHRISRSWTILVVLVAGCTAMPVENIRETNASNIRKLEPGMSRQQVADIMGTGTSQAREGIYLEQRLMGYVDLTVSNPYRIETMAVGGDSFEVLYYYAKTGGMRMGYWDTQFDEGTVPDRFLTPVVLKNGKLVGLGAEVLVRQGLIEAPRFPDQDGWILVGS